MRFYNHWLTPAQLKDTSEQKFISLCFWPRTDPRTGTIYWLERVQVEKHLVGSNVYGDNLSWKVVAVRPAPRRKVI